MNWKLHNQADISAAQLKKLAAHIGASFSHELCGHRNPSYLFTRRKVISFFLFLHICRNRLFFSAAAEESTAACFPCHGKTRVNGGRQKAKTAGVLMNLSRLRQLGPQQFTKKDRRRLARQAFFNYLCSSSRYYYFSDFDILPRCILTVWLFFWLFSWPTQLATGWLSLWQLIRFGPNIVSLPENYL